jgi:hypothetical protein
MLGLASHLLTWPAGAKLRGGNREDQSRNFVGVEYTVVR